MNSASINKICQFLIKHDTLKSINNYIAHEEEFIKRKINSVNLCAENSGVTISINENHTFSENFRELTGIGYFESHYSYEREIVTCGFDNLSSLGYKVKQTISDWHSYLYPEFLKGNRVKMSHLTNYGTDEDGIIIVKEFQNGKTIYELTPELQERIALVKWLYQFFNGKI